MIAAPRSLFRVRLVLAAAVVVGCAPAPRSSGGAALVPDEESRASLEADRLFADGVQAAREQAFVRAADLFRASLAADPTRVETRYNLGLALLETGDLEEATERLQEAAHARPQHAETRYALGSARRRRGEFESAAAEFEAALRLEPSHARAAYALARTLDDLGRGEEARRAWERFLERFPNDARAAEARERLRASPSGSRSSKEGAR